MNLQVLTGENELHLVRLLTSHLSHFVAWTFEPINSFDSLELKAETYLVCNWTQQQPVTLQIG